MKAFIYIEIATDAINVSYETGLLAWVKMTFPDIVVMNLDNYSDSIMVQHCLDLLKQASQLLIFIDSCNQQKVSLGGVFKILQYISDGTFSQKKSKVVLSGKHGVIEKVGKTLGSAQFVQSSSDTEAKKEISLYFSGW